MKANSELELEIKKVRKTFFTLKKILIREVYLPENQGRLHGVFRRLFFVNWCYFDLREDNIATKGVFADLS